MTTNHSTNLSPLKQAYLALDEMQAKLDALERARTEPIPAPAASAGVAIIGLGCRFPGGANDPEAFWHLLRNGVDAIREVPRERWDIDTIYDADPDTPGKTYVRWGGFLDRVDEFDPQLFGIAPREAISMDPQQRLLLEVAWEALEHAGQAPDRLAGSRTGVFIGIASSDYNNLILRAGDAAHLDAYYGSGIAHSVASGRLSYVLGLQGPSVSLDTACSSSLVAVHLACQSLRQGECRMALAGGVHLALSPDNTIAFSRSRMLASDGRCKTFDARADGFGEGEGCGVVILKKLADALADGDRILAVIRGTAANQDGASSGLTAPNGPAQEAVIREALANGGVRPDEVGYIEAHGTGTALGDPIEVQALANVLRDNRSAPFVLGSVKTNVGHLEAAAGVAGLIKVVLSLQHEAIPPHLHWQTPNPHIAWETVPASIPVHLVPWPRGDRRRVAGVSAFGFSGTNVHLVVEEAPIVPAIPNEIDRAWHLLALSAKNEAALQQLADRFEQHLSTHPYESLADVCFSANTGRAAFQHRAAFVAQSTAQLREQLVAFRAGAALTAAAPADRPKIAFLFTGQGAQYVGMGKQLYDTQPIFRAALDRCDEILRPYLGQSLLSIVYPASNQPPATIDQTAFTQPALFAIEYALAEVWKSWAITPSAVMGHSVGEYVAACVAGVFSLEDGLKLIAERGRLMQVLPSGGEMAVVFADEATVAEVIRPFEDQVSIAALNGPDNVVISGVGAAVQQVLGQLQARGIKSKRLTVSHAFHSPLMQPMLDPFERVATTIAYAAPNVRLISNVTGQTITREALTASYWRRHVREAVRFADSIGTLRQLGYSIFVEIGPGTTLLGMGQRCWPDDAGTWLASLRPGQDDWQQLLNSLGTLGVRGAAVDWAGFDRPYARRRMVLPTYPFQRERYWFDTQPAKNDHPSRTTGAAIHPVLGQRVRSALKDIQFEGTLNTERLSILNDHRLDGAAILPATAYLETALAAGRNVLKLDTCVLEEVEIQAMLRVDDGSDQLCQMILSPIEPEAFTWQLFSALNDDEWTLHARGRVRAAAIEHAETTLSVAEVQARCPEMIEAGAHYHQLREHGLDFGASLHGVRRVWRRAGEALGEIQLPEEAAVEAKDYCFHPALLDACLQIIAEAVPAMVDTYLPIGCAQFHVLRRPADRVWSHVTVREADRASQEIFTGDVRVFDLDRRLLAEVIGLQLKRADRAALRREGARGAAYADWLYEIAWQVQNRAEQRPALETAVPLSRLTDRARAQTARLGREHGLTIYDNLLPEMEALSINYVLTAFEQLGWTLKAGDWFTATALAQQLGVIERQQRLLGRLIEMLAEEHLVTREGEGWRVSHTRRAIDPLAQWEKLNAQYPAGHAELSILGRCGPQLAQALRGEAHALQLLFPGGSLAPAEQLYQASPFARTYNSLAAEALREMIDGLPHDRPLRVLEIGAGTGGTTSYVLPVLPPDRTTYTFTDVSPLFLAQAQQKFSAYPFVRYQLLDIENDPEAQGLAAQLFDVVIAANVIHATADLSRTLTHVRQLLAPAGLLIAIEVTRPLRWIDLTFGLTEGWWKFVDRDVRPDYPLLARETWLTTLARSGFGEADAVAGESDRTDAYACQTIVLARATPASGRWLIFADTQGTGDHLAAALRIRGESCVTVTPGQTCVKTTGSCWQVNPAAPEDFQQLLNRVLSEQPALRGVVHLWSLDSTEVSDHDQLLGLGSALHLTQALIKHQEFLAQVPGLWLITRGAQAVASADAPSATSATLWGLARTIALEHPELHCTRIDLATGAVSAGIDRLMLDLLKPDAEDQIAYRDTQRYVARLTPHVARGTLSQLPQQLVISSRGTFDQLSWQPLTRRAPAAHEVEIAVAATGLNLKDVLNVLGLYPGDPGPVGGECAGTIVAVGSAVADLKAGDEVIAVAGGSFATHVIADSRLVVPKPACLSFEEAATIAVPFVTAYFTLHQLGHLRAGERVLIHAAAGGVGLAAVQLAQLAGAEVFATAGSEDKRAYLKSLGVAYVMDSRSLAFADEIMALTQGQGVDVVLNSLAGEFAVKSLAVLGQNGRFLEIGKRDLLTEDSVTRAGCNISYHLVDWTEAARHDPLSIRSILLKIMLDLEAGYLRPLPRRVFRREQAIAAFRYMAQARHIGKIVVTQPIDRSVIRSDATYLITGGLGGLGLLTAQWLVERGARYLVLMGRRAPGEQAQRVITALERSGAQVTIEQGDVAHWADITRVFEHIDRTLPPLRGVIHSAGVLDDGAVLQQDWSRFVAVLAPKVVGAWHLHQLTRDRSLDFCVWYSSIASLLGSAGQGNHAAANAFLDALAYARHAHGLPALSINWGAWGEIGAAVEHGVNERAAQQGLASIAPQQGLEILERLLQDDVTQAGVMPVEWATYLRTWTSRPPFLANINIATVRQSTTSGERRSTSSGTDWLQRILAAPAHKQRQLISAYTQEQAGRVLGVDPAKVGERVPLNELGLDSLMAVELRNRLGTGLQLPRKLPATVVYDYPTIEALAHYLAQQVLPESLPEPIEVANTAPMVVSGGSAAAVIDALEDLSDEEVDRLLAEKMKGA